MPSTTLTTSTTTRSSSRGVAGQSSSFFQPSLILKPKPVERTSSAIFAGLDVDRIPDIGQVPRKRAYSPFPNIFDDCSSAGIFSGGSLSSKARELRPTKSFRFGTERRGTPTVGSRMAFKDASSLDRWEEDTDRSFQPGDEFTNPSLEMLAREFGPAAPDDEDLEISDTECSRHSMRSNNHEFRVQQQTTRKPAAPIHNTRTNKFVQDRRDDPVQDRYRVDSPVNLSRVQHQTTRESAAPMHNTRIDDFVQDRRDDLVQDRYVINSPVNLSNAPHHTSPNSGRLPRAAKSRALTARELLAGKTNKPCLTDDAVIYCSSGNRRAPVKAAPKLRSTCPSEAPPAQSRAKKVTQPRHPKLSSSHATQSIPTQRHPVPPPRQPDSEHTMRTRSAWRCPYDHCHYKTGIPEEAHAHYATHTETRGSASRSSARMPRTTKT